MWMSSDLHATSYELLTIQTPEHLVVSQEWQMKAKSSAYVDKNEPNI